MKAILIADDIVITGVAGRFPSSKNVREFAKNLYGKVDMTDEDETRWSHFSDEIPRRCGKISDIEKFDAAFFSMLAKHADWTDPQMRMLLEHAYEAILDAGICPQTLIGSRTGVFVGCSNTDSANFYRRYFLPKEGNFILGNSQFYLSNRISYALGLCGPSFTVDTACSSSGYALYCALQSIKTGSCDAALVGGSQLDLDHEVAVEYVKLRVLANDGVSRPFDENASGFVRAETNCMIFLQRRKDAKRVYADLIHVNCNNDGYKMEGPTFPSRRLQQRLMEEFYERIKVDPRDVDFVEAHATSTKLGDPEEVAAIDEVFCKKTNRRSELVIGSVKSNMGHAESAAGMASIAKILIAFENQRFPPNINFSTPRSNVPAFEERRIRVATEAEQLRGQLIAMNSFGLGGANAHALFKGNAKEKINFGIPSDDLGRIVLWSGRTEAAVNAIFDDIACRPLDAEHIALLQNSQVQTPNANIFRGFGVFAHDSGVGRAICTQRDIQHFDGTRRPIVFVFSGIGSQWTAMGRGLMQIPLLAESIERSHEVLLTKNVDLKGILASEDPKTFENILNSYVGILAIEIALTDALKALGIEPDFIVGHSVGELGCAYADNCLTAEETILAAFARGEASNEAKNVGGTMAAIGLPHSQLEVMLPPDIDIACHNAKDSTTISGPLESVCRFLSEMEKQKVFAKEVACSGIPLHSRYISEMGERLQGKLKKIIREPKNRSRKWLSSTFAEEAWSSEIAQFSSAAYHTRNLLNPVLFQEVTEMLPTNALTIEIAPHALLKSILKRSLSEGLHASLTQRGSENGAQLFVESLGRLFQHGVDIDIAKLYPAVSFPVSRNTPMISPEIMWDHKENHFTPFFDSYGAFERRNVIINVSDKKYEFAREHVIDGRCLFPATGWIFLVWETFAFMIGKDFEKAKVVIEDVNFLRATVLNRNQDVLITIAIHRGSGRFEVIEGVSVVADGFIRQEENIEMLEIAAPECEKDVIILDTDDFYSNMHILGYHHTGGFRGVKKARFDGLSGEIKWSNNWTIFLDSMTHIERLEKRFWKLALLTGFRKVVIDPVAHNRMLEEKLKSSENGEILFDARVSPYLGVIQAGGVELHDKSTRVVNRRRPREPLLEMQKFIPFFSYEKFDPGNAARIITQTALETIFLPRLTCLEIDSEYAPLSELVSKTLQEIPLLQSSVTTLVTSKEEVELEGVKVSSDHLSSFSEIDILIASSCMRDANLLESAKKVLNSHGYIVSREKGVVTDIPESLLLVAQLSLDTDEVLHMLKFKESIKSFSPKHVIEITSNVSEWLEPLKAALKDGPTLIYAYNRDCSGILGFFNCIRREYPAERLKCIFIMDTSSAPTKFDINDEFFKSQLALNHSLNVYKNGQWGGYRYFELSKCDNKATPRGEHFYVNCRFSGDLSSLTWLSGPLDVHSEGIIRIQFASLNFKDVMLALGRIPDGIRHRYSQECVLGLEFSGIKSDNCRVMGIVRKAGCLATHYDTGDAMLWDVPDAWTLEEAATVPLAYFTVYYAFFVTTKIRRGQSILIHSGSGGVGQAAIRVAFAYGLEVFATVGSDEKKEFLLDKFPMLKPERVGNSHDTSFESMVREKTKGKGVDYVLNSLIGEKLKASIRCLGHDGTLLEVGRLDMVVGTKLDIRHLTQRIKIKAVIFDDFEMDSEERRMQAADLMARDLKAGIITPLSTTIFEAGDVENAFRYMASGKHVGKILIRVRERDCDESSLPLAAIKRTYIKPHEVVFIAGGLGGFGLELAESLVLKGCRKLVLSSKRGITTQLQSYKILFWKSFGAEVLITTADITSESGCEEALELASTLESVTAIYNLAAVLRDGIFDNLNQKMFDECLAPKAKATANLDRISRRLCPNLKHFVVFSSISCGRGSAGQSNYGLGNSVMERIVEERKSLGLPAKAIQWGAVGDVGMLADHKFTSENKNFRGSLAQPIHSCIYVLDALLASDDTFVSSMIVAEKNAEEASTGSIVDLILRVLGVRDRRSISMDATLAQLGMDSLMAVEVQQLLERHFELVFTPQELRSLTLSQLEKRVTSRDIGENTIDAVDETPWLALLLNGAFDPETRELLTTDTIVKVDGIEAKDNTKVLIIPGFFGVASDVYRNLAKQTRRRAFVMQLDEASECTDLEGISTIVQPYVSALFSDSDSFVFVAHSFGALLALLLAKTLEMEGKRGKVIILDSSPLFIQKYAQKKSAENTEEQMRASIAKFIFESFSTIADPNVFEDAFLAHTKWDARLEALLNASADKIPFSFQIFDRRVLTPLVNRLYLIRDVKEEFFGKLESTKLFLIKAAKPSLSMPTDYGLTKCCSDTVDVQTIDGDHVTLTVNPKLPEIIEKLIGV